MATVKPGKTKIIAYAKLKDDKIDSDRLADLMRADMVPESFVPNKHYRDLRSMVRTRLNRVRVVTTHKNMIHAILAKYDYQKPTVAAFSCTAVAQMQTWTCRIWTGCQWTCIWRPSKP